MEITSHLLISKLVLPLARLLATMAVGLLAANLLESLHWTRFVARLSTPLVRLGHLCETAGASFSLAFFSPAASNSLLAEAYVQGRMSRKELVLANLFNSSPTFLVHLPTLLSLAFAFLGKDAFIYVGLGLAAAMLRTLGTIIAGRILLPAPVRSGAAPPERESGSVPWREVARKVLKRFKKRVVSLILFTIPIYCIIFAMQHAGWFAAMEGFMARHMSAVPFLRPEALGIVVLHLAAEAGAAFSAAAALGASGALESREIIMALMVGNILSSPMRAFRHQFPSYAGFFAPPLAFLLVVMNQLCRAGSLVVMAILYYYLAF